jgi:hypothetical protein
LPFAEMVIRHEQKRLPALFFRAWDLPKGRSDAGDAQPIEPSNALFVMHRPCTTIVVVVSNASGSPPSVLSRRLRCQKLRRDCVA